MMTDATPIIWGSERSGQVSRRESTGECRIRRDTVGVGDPLPLPFARTRHVQQRNSGCRRSIGAHEKKQKTDVMEPVLAPHPEQKLVSICTNDSAGGRKKDDCCHCFPLGPEVRVCGYRSYEENKLDSRYR